MRLDKPSKSPIPTPPETQAIGQAVAPIANSHAFAVELWARSRRTMPGNQVLSPATLKTALVMPWSGARGQTASEMQRALQLESTSYDIVSSAGLLLHAWNAVAGRAFLRVASRLFGEKDFSFAGSYLDMTHVTFGAPLGLVGFKDSARAARSTINTWVARQTEGHIQALIPEGGVDESTRLVLVNALCFQGEWDIPFRKKHSRPEAFFGPKGAQKLVPMMHGMDRFPFAALDGVKVVELPYEGRDLSLVCVLPDAVDGLDALEQGLTSARIERWLAALKPERTRISLPRFEAVPSGSLLLNDVLKSLGMERAFSPAQADFTGIARPSEPGDNLALSRVFQHASLKVFERGSETPTSASGPWPLEPGVELPLVKSAQEFRADHPFLFFLRDKRSGTLLLMGRVCEPESASQRPISSPGDGAATSPSLPGGAWPAARANPAAVAPDTEPEPFGRYELLRKISNGGTSELWLARPRDAGRFARPLAIKRFRPQLAEDPEFVQVLEAEALIAARFHHPNLAEVYEFGQADGTCYLAMEYVDGKDLGQVLRKASGAGQWISRHLALRIIASACEGLHHAHTRRDDGGRPLKMVHRDLSPRSILLGFDGPVKLVDFGLAHAVARLGNSGPIDVRFHYMAPEQAAGKELDARTDIFALGMVLYELLTGALPFKRDSQLATLQAALECRIQPPSQVVDVPPELDPVVMNALARSPDERYRDARQFQKALEELLVSQGWVAGSVQISELMEALFADGPEEG
ncbi:serpin family protein [Hyalangium gracile]|uniref:serpin family protein n=1 Tax=Hyalangium gracile TaxID=394092 RepID=UPI001CC926F8|nr:serpin family protein [Hyalangium gracile]